MKTRIFFSLCLATLSAAMSSAQTIPPARLGLSLGATINSVSPSIAVWRASDVLSSLMTDIRNAEPNARFLNTGSGFGGALGVTGAIPLTSTVHLGGTLGYHSMPTSITSEQLTPTVTATHNLALFSSMLQIAPQVELYGLFGNVSMHPIVGLDIGIPLSTTESRNSVINQQNVEQTQLISENAPIENASTRAALLLGVGYTFKADSNVFIQPYITYSQPLTNVSSSAVFSPTAISQLRVGVSVLLGFTSTTPILTSREPLTGSMEKITGIDGENRESVISAINVEDVRYNEMFPLVPYIFCNEGGLPDENQQYSNFSRMSGNFMLESLPLDAMEVNKNLLNIIAVRMKKFPQAALTITGTTDGKKEASDKSLPSVRAEWAKVYLTEQCGIEQARILVKSSTLPSRPSALNDPDGIVENRRIELSSNVPDVLAPVMLTADNQRVANYDVVVFYPTVSDSSITSWTLNIMQAGRTMRTLAGMGRPQPIRWAMRANELSAAQVPVDYDLVVRRDDNDSVVIAGSIPVDYISSVRKKTENLPDRTVDKYSLILFDFDKSTLGEENQRILEQMVLPNISAISRVSIVGYSDRIGNDEYNAKLSRERAESVRAFLQSRARDARFYTMGVGETTEVFTNNSPIGRQLSRTVQVIVETPRR